MPLQEMRRWRPTFPPSSTRLTSWRRQTSSRTGSRETETRPTELQTGTDLTKRHSGKKKPRRFTKTRQVIHICSLARSYSYAFSKEKNEDFIKTLYSLESSVLGTTPWHQAAKTDHVELMEFIWNNNMHYSIRDGINGKDKEQKRPLHIACYNGSHKASSVVL